MARVAVIGGSGLERLFEKKKRESVLTPHGRVEYSMIDLDGEDVLFIPRHGFEHSLPPHKVNYRGIIWTISWKKVHYVIATNAVGSLREEIEPGSVVIPDQFLDFTKTRPTTFYDDEVVHTDMTEPYSRIVREKLREAAEKRVRVHYGGVYVCTEGPRYETPAEIRAFRILGGDIVGMTGVPEVVLAREKGLEYAALAVVTNYAAGMQGKITHEEVVKLMERMNPVVAEIIADTVRNLASNKT